MESKLSSTEDLNKKYNKLIDDILQKYIKDAIDTKKHITYHIEQKEVEPDAEFDPHSEDDIEDDSEEPYYEVIVYKASIRLYIQKFNNLFSNEFDEWLLKKVSEPKQKKVSEPEQKKCSHDITIKQDRLLNPGTTYYNEQYMDDLVKEIKTAITESCYPFVVFNIILHFTDDRAVTHANTFIIQYSEDHSHILIVYYEPHGSNIPLIHDRIKIKEILDIIKYKLPLTYDVGKQPKVDITWGVDECGIQHKDRVGLCRIFTRFWTHITLQLLTLCIQDKSNDCLFSKLLPLVGERRLQELIKSQFSDDKDKDYDVILTWMYRMIVEFLIQKNEDNKDNKDNKIKLKNEHEKITNSLKKQCIDGKKESKECSMLTEYFTATRFYTEFESIPPPNNIIEREKYIDNIINSESDLQLEKKLAILQELITRNKNLQEKNLKILKNSKYLYHLPEIIHGYSTWYDKDIRDNVDIVEKKLKILKQNKKNYKQNLENVEKQIKLQINRYKRLDDQWKKIDLNYSNKSKRKNHKDIVNNDSKKKLKQNKTEN